MLSPLFYNKIPSFLFIKVIFFHNTDHLEENKEINKKIFIIIIIIIITAPDFYYSFVCTTYVSLFECLYGWGIKVSAW